MTLMSGTIGHQVVLQRFCSGSVWVLQCVLEFRVLSLCQHTAADRIYLQEGSDLVFLSTNRIRPFPPLLTFAHWFPDDVTSDPSGSFRFWCRKFVDI